MSGWPSIANPCGFLSIYDGSISANSTAITDTTGEVDPKVVARLPCNTGCAICLQSSCDVTRLYNGVDVCFTSGKAKSAEFIEKSVFASTIAFLIDDDSALELGLGGNQRAECSDRGSFVSGNSGADEARDSDCSDDGDDGNDDHQLDEGETQNFSLHE